MSAIRSKAKLFKIGSWTLLRLPESASAKLPSRGMTMVEGTINGFHFQAALEPDGKGSHWFRVDKAMREAAGADAGDTVTLAIEPTREWPEPKVPADLKNALTADPQAHTLWMDITPMARWDWIRWIRSSKQPETRRRRIETACSKLKAGQRRPCCFNRSLCTEPSVSHNGVLLEPS
ncbi:MAG: YdeI/OmpD-associated family protein [Micromonosporaceae bacterium]